jgi:hypothetical protein
MTGQFEVGIISVRYEQSVEGIKNFLTQFGASADTLVVQKTSNRSGLIKLSKTEEAVFYFKKGKVQKNELIKKLSSIERQSAQKMNPEMELLPLMEKPYDQLVFDLVDQEDRKRIDRDYFGIIAKILYERDGDRVIPFIKELSLSDASQILLRIEEHFKRDREEEKSSFLF